MKRDMDLIRTILLELEEADPTQGWYEITIPGRSEVEIAYHVRLMDEAGLIDAQDLSSNSGLVWKAKRLTYDGHEFLDAARNDTLWNKAKDKVLSSAGTVTLEGLKIALGVIIKTAVLGTGSSA